MKILAVGGLFDDQGGRPSGYAHKLFEAITCAHVVNGGSWELLCSLSAEVVNFDVVLWLPQVDNQREKLVRKIKINNPEVLLVTSKRNNDEYSFLELVARALATKSNLCIEFRTEDGIHVGTLFDPLGNVFALRERDIKKLAVALINRLFELDAFTRVRSVQIGEAVCCPDSDFFTILRQHADRFHELVHTPDQSRLLGNASFRCIHGFPSMRFQDNLIFVSRRNIDKRSIGPDGMVGVSLNHSSQSQLRLWPSETIGYYGDAKPSVDTPLHIALYGRYPNVNYMLHSHVYIEGAPFASDHVIPCGALEEFTQTQLSSFPPTISNFSVNLRGHGSLACAADFDYLRTLQYVARPCPEIALAGEQR